MQRRSNTRDQIIVDYIYRTVCRLISRGKGTKLLRFSAWQDVGDADMIRRTKGTAAIKCAIGLVVLPFAMRKINAIPRSISATMGVSFLLHRHARIYIEAQIASQVQMPVCAM